MDLTQNALQRPIVAVRDEVRRSAWYDMTII